MHFGHNIDFEISLSDVKRKELISGNIQNYPSHTKAMKELTTILYSQVKLVQAKKSLELLVSAKSDNSKFAIE